MAAMALSFLQLCFVFCPFDHQSSLPQTAVNLPFETGLARLGIGSVHVCGPHRGEKWGYLSNSRWYMGYSNMHL